MMIGSNSHLRIWRVGKNTTPIILREKAATSWVSLVPLESWSSIRKVFQFTSFLHPFKFLDSTFSFTIHPIIPYSIDSSSLNLNLKMLFWVYMLSTETHTHNITYHNQNQNFWNSDTTFNQLWQLNLFVIWKLSLNLKA